MEKVKVVIIGMGRMGKTRYAALKRHNGYYISAICDNNKENMVEFAEPKYTEWKQCIKKSGPNAVFVCTYNAVIPDIVCFALEKGCAVFAEKPPGRNLQDALRMQTVYGKTKKPILKFGFNHRYHDSVLEAKALVDSKILGELVCARGVYGKAGNVSFAKEWRNQTEISGGGIMLDQGIHMLDLLYYFLGEFTEVQSSVDHLVWKNLDVEDSAFSILKTRDGKVASLHSSAIQWRHRFNLDLICTNGYISLNGLLTSTQSYGEEQISYYVKDLEQRTGHLGKPLEHTLCFNEDHSWDYEVEEFYNAVVKGTPIHEGTMEDAVKVMAMIEKIYEKGGKKI